MRLCCRLVSALVAPSFAILVVLVTASSATSAQQSNPAIRPVAAAHPGGAETFKRLYDFGLGKRASYVAEYKRLPMYNFGIGKRGELSGSRPLGTLGTLGAAPPGMYAFGIGKRGGDETGWDDDMENSQTDFDDISLYDLSKRGRMYSMGIGKRGRLQYSFGIGKRVPTDSDPRLADVFMSSDLDDDILELNNGMDHHDAMKRRAPQQYAFGLGKRRPGKYDFGIGKRTPGADDE